MLTVRFKQLGLTPGDLVLDAGAGFGRHAFEIARLGGRIVALDYADEEVRMTRATFGAMIEAKDIAADRYMGALRGDATKLPFADNTFDRVITSEVLEHIQDDVAAIAELARVVRPGGTLACTVRSFKITHPEFPEYQRVGSRILGNVPRENAVASVPFQCSKQTGIFDL